MTEVLFVSTSHIAKESVEKIKSEFFSFKPDIICVELDRNRLHALLTNRKPDYSIKNISKIGLKGYLFAVIGGFIQRKLGRMVGMQPGVDMKQAAILAKNNNLLLVLLDRDISVTLSRLSKAITFKEKMRFLNDLLFGWLKKEQKIKINLAEVPTDELITKMMKQLKDRYPSLYNVLLEERNHFMAKRLVTVQANHPDKKIMVVIGAGHEKGLIEAYEHYKSMLEKKGSL